MLPLSFDAKLFTSRTVRWPSVSISSKPEFSEEEDVVIMLDVAKGSKLSIKSTMILTMRTRIKTLMRKKPNSISQYSDRYLVTALEIWNP